MLQIVHTQLRETRVESVAPDSKLQGVDNTGSRHGQSTSLQGLSEAVAIALWSLGFTGAELFLCLTHSHYDVWWV